MTPTPAASTPGGEELIALGREARAAFARVAGRLTPSDDQQPTLCREFTVAALLAHLERSMILLGDCAGGDVESEPAGPTTSRVCALADATLAAWAERGFGGEVRLGSRTLPAADVYAIVLLELAVHAHDLGVALDPPAAAAPSASLVQYLLERAPVLITPDRRGQSFAPEVTLAQDAPAFERLLAFTGRQP